MQLLSVPSIFLVCALLIASVHGQCPDVANKIYLITLNITGVPPFYSLLTFLPGGAFINIPSEGSSLTKNQYSNIVGNYRCVNSTTVTLAGTAFFYPNANATNVGATGAIGLFTYELKFKQHQSRLSGLSLLAYYKPGTNPYNPNNEATHVGSYAENKGILLEQPKFK